MKEIESARGWGFQLPCPHLQAPSPGQHSHEGGRWLHRSPGWPGRCQGSELPGTHLADRAGARVTPWLCPPPHNS